MFIFLTLAASFIALMSIASVMATISELRRETKAYHAEFARDQAL